MLMNLSLSQSNVIPPVFRRKLALLFRRTLSFSLALLWFSYTYSHYLFLRVSLTMYSGRPIYRGLEL